jgi:hypothetical protein
MCEVDLLLTSSIKALFSFVNWGAMRLFNSDNKNWGSGFKKLTTEKYKTH